MFGILATALVGFVTVSLYAQAEMLTNPGFESWALNGPSGPPDNWAIYPTSNFSASQEATTIHGGTYSTNLTWSTTSNRDFEQIDIPVMADSDYTFSAWAYDNDPAGRVRIYIRWEDSGGGYISNFYSPYSSDSPSWQLLTTGSATAPSTAAQCAVRIRCYDVSAGWDGDATVLVDDASFTAVVPVGPIPVSIYDIQYTTAPSGDSPYEDSLVQTSGIVTVSSDTFPNGYFIQDGAGAWNGIYVYDNANTVSEGDDITITGTVDEYYSKTEIDNVTSVMINSSGNPLPAASIISTNTVNTSEAYEGVLVKVEDVVVTNASLPNGEWAIDDGSDSCLVDDWASYSYSPALGNCLHVTGIVDYSYGNFKIEPRYDADIELLLFPPVVSVSDTTPTVNEGVALSFAVDGSDPRPGETVTLSALGLPPGATFTDGSGNPVSGSFDWTPNYGQAGTYAVTFIATDGGCSPTLADTLEVTITVNDVNQPPLVTLANSSWTVDEGVELSFDVQGTDTDTCDGDLVALSVDGLPSGAGFTDGTGNPVTGTFTWTPNYGQAGVCSLTFIGTDDHTPSLADSVEVIITVNDVNQGPHIAVSDTNPEVDEGNVLTLTVYGSDPDTTDKDDVVLSVQNSPPGATFTDGTGNPITGTFEWTPNFCQGDSVYTVTFIASDIHTKLQASVNVQITVNDVDQKPTITAIYTYYQGKELYDIPTNTITAFDPDTLDKDDVIIHVLNLPDSAHFTLHQSNPAIGCLDWMPLWNQGDSTYTITFIAQGVHSKDLYDSVKVTIDVVDKVDEAFTLSIDSVAAWPCQHVDVPVSLCGSYPVGAYNVLIHWDCSMADLIGVEQKWYHVNGDSFKFEYFNWTTWEVDDGCKVRVVGLHDKPNDVDTPPMDPGQDQLVFDLFFEVSNTWDINYEIPITFEVDECGDNALSDPTGYVLYTPPDPGDAYGDTTCPLEPLPPGYPENPSVALIGGVIYHSDIAEEYVGDINLNETPYEIADAVMYLEYLNGEAELIPGREAEQSAASDVNLDGTPWSIADVVLLIDIINGYAEPLAKVAPSSEVVEVTIPEEATDHTQISVHSPTALGGAYLVIKHDGQIGVPILAGRAEGMNLDYSDRDGELRVIIYSWKSNQIEQGDGALFTVSGKGKISLRKVQFSDPYGSLMKVKTSIIPIAFKLAQNYPNPFNPVTTIAFDLPRNSDVTLTIYNIMGEKVETLVSSGLKAGHYEVNWNARSVSSGIYFYTINAGSFTDTKKMVLMK